MTTLTIPVDSENPDYNFQIDLDGATYTLDFKFNGRANTWQMSIFDASGENLIIGSVPVLEGIDLLYPYEGVPGRPPGNFIAINETGGNDLGTDIKLYYETIS